MRFGSGAEQSTGIKPQMKEQSALPTRRNIEALSEPMRQRAREVETVATNILHGEMHSLDNVDGNGNKPTNEQIQADPRLNLFGRLRHIAKLPETPPGQSISKDAGDLIPAPGEPLQHKLEVVLDDDSAWTIDSIDARNGDNFMCTINDGQGTIETRPIPRSLLMKEQLLSEQDVVRDSIKTKYGEDSAEFKIVNSYLESIGGTSETSLDKTDSAEVDKLLTEAAETRHLFIADVARAFIDQRYPGIPQAPEGTSINLSDEKLKQLAERDKLLKLLEGKTVLDFDTFKAVFGQDIPADLSAVKLKVNQLQQELLHTPKDQQQDKQREISQAQEQQLILQDAQSSLEPGGAIEQFFNGVQTGQIPPETAETVINQFSSNEVFDMIDSFINARERAQGTIKTELQTQESKARRQKTMKISLAVVLAMLAAGAASSSFMKEQ